MQYPNSNSSLNIINKSNRANHRFGTAFAMVCFFLVILFILADVTKALPVERNVDFTISNESETVNGEQIVTLTVGSNNWVNVVKGIAAFNIKIEYDKNVFEYIETKPTAQSLITIGKDEFTATAQNVGVLAVLYMDNDFKTPIPSEGEILKIKFKVIDKTVTGGYRFKLYGDNVVVDGQLPQFNSIPVYYPSPSTIFLVGSLGEVTPTPTTPEISPSPTVSVTPEITGNITPFPTTEITKEPTSSVTPIPTSANSSSAISNPTKDYISIVKDVTEKIEKLPERLTTDDAKDVKAILKEYNKLPDDMKKKVVNFDKLEKLTVIADSLIAERNKSLTFKIIISIVVVVCLAFAAALIVRIRKRK